MFTRVAALIVLAIALAAPTVLAEDAEVEAMVERIFDGDLSGHANVVLEDAARKLFWAFHTAKFLDVYELRVYMVPFESTRPNEVRRLLDKGDDDGAFELLLAEMNLSLGAQYLADVGLNGISEVPVPVGQGSMQDNFHREQFANHAAADKVYRQWLQRAVTLKERAS
jgi:hypothetical protein